MKIFIREELVTKKGNVNVPNVIYTYKKIF